MRAGFSISILSIAVVFMMTLANVPSDVAGEGVDDPRVWYNVYQHELEDWAECVVTDSQGNVYIGGLTGTWGDLWGMYVEYYDFLVCKYDANGTPLWMRTYDGPLGFTDRVVDMAVDSQDNIVVTGFSHLAYGEPWICTIKYDPSGEVLWLAREVGPLGTSYPVAVVVDPWDNVVVSGCDNHWGSEVNYMTIKYAPDGAKLWQVYYDGPGGHPSGMRDDVAADMVVDDAGDIFVTGRTRTEDSVEWATVKYDPDGGEDWVRLYAPKGGSGTPVAMALCGDGDVVITGRTSEPGRYSDITTVRYSPHGSRCWVHKYDGPAAWEDIAVDLVVDGQDNAIVLGRTYGNGYDMTTISIDARGRENWVRIFDGPVHDHDYPRAVGVDTSGNVFITGDARMSNDNYYGSNHDLVTVCYSPAGNVLWTDYFDGYNGRLTDTGTAVGSDCFGNTYVAGGTLVDYATLSDVVLMKYREGSAMPSEPVSGLIDDVMDLGLDSGTENSLLSKLDGVQAAIDGGNTGAAANKLEAFINECEAQSGKAMTVAEANALIAAAQAILATL